MCTVDGVGGQVTDGACGGCQRTHGHQVTAHVRVLDDRHGLGRAHAWLAALTAVARIGQRLLEGALGDRQALHERIRVLSLDSTDVTDAGVSALTGMAELKDLNLYHTLVTDAGMDQLRAALPECEIVFDRDSALPTRRSK